MTKPWALGRPRDPALAVEGNRGRSELVRAGGPGHYGERLYPGAGSTVATKGISSLHGLLQTAM